MVYEPELLKSYSDSIKDWKSRFRALLSPMGLIALISISVYLAFGIIIAGFDLPSYFPKQFKPELQEVWYGSFFEKWLAYCSTTFKKYLIDIIIYLAVGIVVGLTGGLAIGLAYGLAFGLAFGLAVSLVYGFAQGLAFGLAYGFAVGLAYGLVVSLVFGLAVGLAYSLVYGLTFGLAFFINWIIFDYRLYSYTWYSVKCILGKYSLVKNPHLHDGVIGFPIWGMAEQFQKEAFEDPEKGTEFTGFLFTSRRILQYPLAYQIRLASTAGHWRKNRLDPFAIKNYPFPSIEYSSMMVKDEWVFFQTSRTEKLFSPPNPDWYTQLESTRTHLSDFEQESNVQIRVRYFRTFREELNKLYDLALRQPPEWNEYFVKALELWKKSAADKLRDLELEAAAEEPIAANIYRGGEKLKPEDKELFLGRADLRDAFKKRVVTAVQMPLFFVQGQRRVGKSSLIAFLPSFLDRGFTVVSFDMQEHPGLTLRALLQKLRERIHSVVLGQNAPETPLPDDWAGAWQAFREELDGIASAREARIVLAIDEYEELQKILQTNPEQGGALLGAMRSWSQSQNRVVFLFAGADFFSELKSPNWAEYFVQAERLYVDYLGHDDSLALINLVGLKYPAELLERMYRETQGHPCLLQKICREIVTIANKEGRESRAIVEADYEEALRRVLLMPDDGVVNIFWQQFCENRGLKDTIRQILRGETPTDEKALLVLEDHRFIVRDAAGVRMRVPLFELWLRRYQVT